MDYDDLEAMREKVINDIDGLFDEIDDDENGYIEKDELIAKVAEGFELLPPSIANNMSNEQQIGKFFSIADKDGDGRVTREELTSYFLKLIKIE